MKRKEKSPDTEDLLPEDKDKLPDHDKDNLPENDEKKSTDGDESKESNKLDESSLDDIKTGDIDEAFESMASVQNLKSLSGVSVKQIDNVSLDQLKSLKITNGIDDLANVSTAEVSLNKPLNKNIFSSHSGFDNFKSKIPNGSASPNQNTKIFKTGEASTASGQMRPRHNDAEVKIFEDIASQLGAKKGDVGIKVFNDVKGKIKLKTELCPCGSCSGVIGQFKIMFPKVDIEILSQPKVSF